jgi:thioredoxin-like negative regulator of GroEL
VTLQGKHDAALAAVRGPLDASFSLSAERREAEAAILMAKGDLEAAAGLYAQALKEQPDDWAVLLLYLDCMLPATASSLPACGSTAVAQMVTGVEASTRPGCQIGGLAALLDAMKIGEANSAARNSKLTSHV